MTVISLIWNQKERGFGNAGDPGSIPVSGRSPREGNGNHSSTLAWKIPWMEEPHRLQFMGLQSWTQLSDFAFAFLVSPWGSYLRGAQREGLGGERLCITGCRGVISGVHICCDSAGCCSGQKLDDM